MITAIFISAAAIASPSMSEICQLTDGLSDYIYEFSGAVDAHGNYQISKSAKAPWPFSGHVVVAAEEKGSFASGAIDPGYVVDLTTFRAGKRIVVYRGGARNDANSVPVLTGVCRPKTDTPRSIRYPQSTGLNTDILHSKLQVSFSCRAVLYSGQVSKFDFTLARAESNIMVDIAPKDTFIWSERVRYEGIPFPNFIGGNPAQWVILRLPGQSNAQVGIFRVNSSPDGNAATMIEFNDFQSAEASRNNGIVASCVEPNTGTSK